MPDTPEILIDAFITNTTQGATNPKVVTLSDGRMLVAYATEDGGNPGFDIRGQLFATDGTPIGEEFLFEHNPNRQIDERDFDMVAVDGNRVAMVVETDPSADNEDIATRLFEIDETGARIADGGTTHGSNNGDFFNPTITDTGGANDYRHFHIDRDGSFEEIDMRGLENGDVADFDLDRGFRGNASAELASTTLENGNIVVVLDRDGVFGRDEQILVMIVTPNGDIVREFNIGSSDEQQFQPTVIALKGGGFVVAFGEDDGDIDPAYQVFDANGDAVSGLREFGTEAVPGRSRNDEPALAPLEDGGFIAFYDNDIAGQIRGQRFDAEGNRVGEDFLVADEDGTQLDATLLNDGRVAVSYFLPSEGVVKTAILEIAEEEIIISGTKRSDELVGTNADETILGLGGADRIDGLGGADTIDGGNGNDQINGGAGNDSIEGGRGNDEIDGGGGNDNIDGGRGNDQITGGAGRDNIDGGSGQDVLNGSFGNDVLNGGAGNDNLTGGGGNDKFVFSGDFGDDTITDFGARNNREDIDLSAISGIDSFSDLAGALSQQGNDVVINLAEGTITLENVNLADLDANDFLF